MLRIGLIFKRTGKNRFNIFDPPRHRHVLVQYFEGFHYPQFPVFQLLVCYRIADIAQLIRVPMVLLHLFVPANTALLPTRRAFGSLALRRLPFLQRGLLMGLLDLHEVEQMLGVGFPLEPELVFLHHLKNVLKEYRYDNHQQRNYSLIFISYKTIILSMMLEQ